MVLLPVDILVALKLVASGKSDWTYSWLANELGLSTSQVHAAANRLMAARLLDKPHRHGGSPNRTALEEFLIHGVKYVFITERGGLTRGIPTAYAAPPLRDQIVQGTEPPPVWPHPEGTVRGLEFSPIHDAAPAAALSDPALYELLALTDALRDGRRREQEIARRELAARLRGDVR